MSGGDPVTDDQVLPMPEPGAESMSPTIGKLAGALAKAQAKITGATKDSENPFFKSKYADLAAVLDAARGPLSENGLAVIQTTAYDNTGICMITTLAHESGEWIRGKLWLRPTKADPQGMGSAITYARRYAYAAIVGIAQVDDDGNAASAGQIDDNPVDMQKVMAAVDLCREIVDEDNEESGPQAAKEIYQPLSNDERIELQRQLKEIPIKKANGRMSTYWAVFHSHLKLAAQRDK